MKKSGFEKEIKNAFYEVSHDTASIKFEVETGGEAGTCLIVYELPILRKNPCGADPAVHCGFSDIWTDKEANYPDSLTIDDGLADNKMFDCVCLTHSVGNRELGFKAEHSYVRYKQTADATTLVHTRRPHWPLFEHHIFAPHFAIHPTLPFLRF